MSDEERLVRVARALCEADGHDPDELISVGTEDIEKEVSGIGYRRMVRAPAWTAHKAEAKRLVTAIRAMGLLV